MPWIAKRWDLQGEVVSTTTSRQTECSGLLGRDDDTSDNPLVSLDGFQLTDANLSVVDDKTPWAARVVYEQEARRGSKVKL
jgi:hypothetical protein